MTTLDEKLRQQIKELVNAGIDIISIEDKKQKNSEASTSDGRSVSKILSSQTSYQEWYSQTLPIVKQLLPDRYGEFQEMYKIEKRNPKDFSALTYTISDYFLGFAVVKGEKEIIDRYITFVAKFQHQINILRSALTHIDSILADIRGTLQAELFDDEVQAAHELMKKGHLRASGAVAGVMIERHLGQVTKNHSLTIKKAEPTIADFNEALKADGILDIPNWRFIQRLGDIRNLCVHSKGREPTKDEVEELISGTEKIIHSFV